MIKHLLYLPGPILSLLLVLVPEGLQAIPGRANPIYRAEDAATMPNPAVSTDGPMHPLSGLVSDGTLLYGTTPEGGLVTAARPTGNGTIYSFNPVTKIIATLHRFGAGSPAGSPFGYSAVGGLLYRTDGYFYGTTVAGGVMGHGTIFRFRPATPGQPAVFVELASFNGLTTNPTPRRPAGAAPKGRLEDGENGWLYGTTREGGAGNFGTVYRISPTTLVSETLVEFTGTGGAKPGRAPESGLTMRRQRGSFPSLWGATSGGGTTADHGTLFSLGLAGLFSHQHSFDGSHGGGPHGQLLLNEGAMWGGVGSAWFYYPLNNDPLIYTYPGFGGMERTLTATSDGLVLGAGLFLDNADGRVRQAILQRQKEGTGTYFSTPLALLEAPGFPGLVGDYIANDRLCLGPDQNYYGTAAFGGWGGNTDNGEGPGVIFMLRHLPVVETLTPAISGLRSFIARGSVKAHGMTVTPSFQFVNANQNEFGIVTTPPGASMGDGSFRQSCVGNEDGADYFVRAVAHYGTEFVTGEWVRFTPSYHAAWTYANLSHYGQEAVEDEAVSGPLADPDGDGVGNFLEWMRGTSPGYPHAPLLPSVSEFRGSQIVEFRFPITQQPWADEWLYLETSTDLVQWQRAASMHFTGVTSPYLATEPELASAFPKRFYRATAGQSPTGTTQYLFNTGQSASHTLLGEGVIDPHWTVEGIETGSVMTLLAAPGAWLSQGPDSAWIVPSRVGTYAPPGVYTYSTTFLVPEGVDPYTISLTGRYACDDTLIEVQANTSNWRSTTLTGGSYSAWSPEFLIRGNWGGNNQTVSFKIQNASLPPIDDNPSGLRVELKATWARAGHVVVPDLRSTGAINAYNTLWPEGETANQPTFYFSSAAGNPVGPVGGYLRNSTSQPAAWLGDTNNSLWLCPGAALNAQPGTYFTEIFFDLSNFDHRSFELRARLAADDSCLIHCNGVPVATIEGYDKWTHVLVNQGNAPLVPQGNVLQFFLRNAGTTANPCGLRMEILHAAAVPKP